MLNICEDNGHIETHGNQKTLEEKSAGSPLAMI